MIEAIKVLERLLDNLVSAGFMESEHDNLRAVIKVLNEEEHEERENKWQR